MISAMRSKLGPKVIGGVIAVVAFVFIFYGIFVPGSSSSKGPGVAGEVNGETITYSEFSRALNQRVEFFKSMMGGKVSEAQLEQFRIGESVFKELTQRKVLGQVARKQGFYPSEEQIRDQIVKMDVFQKDGRFDRVTYKNVLSANRLTPVRFEELIGQDIMEQNFKVFLGQLAVVVEDEVTRELKSAKDRHKVKYVYLDNESARKLLPKDLKPEDQSKRLNEKVAEIGKLVLPLLSSGADAKVNAALKDAKVVVKISDWLSAQSNVIPGVGSVRSVQEDLYSMKKGDPAKSFSLMGGTLFAVSVAHEDFDPKRVSEKDRSAAFSKIQNEKQGDIVKRFVDDFMKDARVSSNSEMIKSGKGGGMPLTFGD
ncbi:MAG: SurA N-terminal domain-containing protein [Bdellovibrionales bacterium]|nr:SurA N-terminal domain-containing protein [Bdellovibrionales bacterium]